ncbi:MAG: hypothetical protein ABSD57_13500 [Verrucomicrobiota bacterium]
MTLPPSSGGTPNFSEEFSISPVTKRNPKMFFIKMNVLDLGLRTKFFQEFQIGQVVSPAILNLRLSELHYRNACVISCQNRISPRLFPFAMTERRNNSGTSVGDLQLAEKRFKFFPLFRWRIFLPIPFRECTPLV